MSRHNLSKQQFMSTKDVGELWSGDYETVGPAKFLSKEHLHNEEHYENVKKDIKEHGVKTPLEVSKDEGGYLLDGHHRYLAARELGIEKLPVKHVKFGK